MVPVVANRHKKGYGAMYGKKERVKDVQFSNWACIGDLTEAGIWGCQKLGKYIGT
jgi:hypothetical protein